MGKHEVWKLRAEVAVMNLFRVLEVKPYGALELTRMGQMWPEYGLRTQDLRGAIARLSERGQVRILARRDGDRIMLTERGARWSASLPGWLEYQLLVPRRSAYQARMAPWSTPSRPLTERRNARTGLLQSLGSGSRSLAQTASAA